MVSNNICGGRALSIAAGITMLVLLLAGGAEAVTITVNASGGADYTRIQDAIDNAIAGDTILVQSGTYSENVNVTKQLILKGMDTGGGMPEVDARGSGDAITLNADNSTLEGFIAINSGWGYAGIKVYSNNNTIKNNNASNNALYGILLNSSSNNVLSNNSASNNNYGIKLDSSSKTTISGNNIFNNSDGIILDLVSDYNVLSNNNAWKNSEGIGLRASSNNNLLISNNASNNGNGIVLQTTNNTLNGNNALKNSNGIWLLYSSNNTLNGNNASNNYYGIAISYSSYNIFNDNTANLNDGSGFNLYGSSNNTLSDNSVISNNWRGILLQSSTNNVLYKNNLIDNSNYNAYDDSSNYWDNGTVGNHYSNFDEPAEGCIDANFNGICDSSNAIIGGGSSIDRYPLVSWSYSGTSTLSNSGGGTWPYYRDITITNPGAALTDYQVLVNLTSAAFPTGANTSGADIRFTDAGGAELAYWIESWDYANRSALVWVNVTSVPAGASSMRMWYGNPSASSSSNIGNTFIFGDNFEGTSVNTNKWSVVTGNPLISDGKIFLSRSSDEIKSVSTFSLPFISEAYVMKNNAYNYEPSERASMNIIENASTDVDIISLVGEYHSGRCTIPYGSFDVYNEGVWQGYHCFSTRLDDGTYKRYKITVTSNLQRGQVDSDVAADWNMPFNTVANYYIDFKAIWSTYGADMYVDWVFVRKYASPEPQITFASYNLTGRVLNASSDLGIPGALVKLDEYPQYNATTNITGDYSMSVPAGTYQVSSSAPGYSTNTTTVTVSADAVQDFELSPGPITITVNASGGADYTSIQAAINAASGGDTITVAAGIYNENVDVNKSVNLIGAGAEVTLVNASNPYDHVFNVTASSVNISGFTFTGTVADYKAGIYLNGANYTNISNNNASNNVYGIYLYSSGNITLSGNTASTNSYGIWLEYSNNNTLSGNNASANYHGIGLYYSGNNTIYNNRFSNSVNFYSGGTVYSNTWNTTKTAGTNIRGGPYLGGNFWANPSGTGFSQTCTDANIDGVCDLSYPLASENVDFLPLAVPSGYINGTVLDNGTGIAGAIVITNTSLNTSTNISGFYSLKVPAGTYNLTAASEPRYYPNSSIMVTVVAGATTVQDIELLKKPTGIIAGTVTNAT